MATELPLLRLGPAGFSLEQQQQLRTLVAQADTTGLDWTFSSLADADVCLVSGARLQVLDGTLRIGSGVPGERSIQIDPATLERPIAYAMPMAPRNFVPELCFELELDSVRSLLRKLANSFRPQVAQYCLASQVLRRGSKLGEGVQHLMSADGKLIAVVDPRGDAGVLPGAAPQEFEAATWVPQGRQLDGFPTHFVRCSMSRLMWQYAVRTTRDVLPPRYRTDKIYFRRAPRLTNRMLRDAHLLLLRELWLAPGTFAELQVRTGLDAQRLAPDLAALYLVGAITSNPKRATAPVRRPEVSEDSDRGTVLPSMLSSDGMPSILRDPAAADMTVPAPLTHY